MTTLQPLTEQNPQNYFLPHPDISVAPTVYHSVSNFPQAHSLVDPQAVAEYLAAPLGEAWAESEHSQAPRSC